MDVMSTKKPRTFQFRNILDSWYYTPDVGHKDDKPSDTEPDIISKT